MASLWFQDVFRFTTTLSFQRPFKLLKIIATPRTRFWHSLHAFPNVLCFWHSSLSIIYRSTLFIQATFGRTHAWRSSSPACWACCDRGRWKKFMENTMFFPNDGRKRPTGQTNYCARTKQQAQQRCHPGLRTKAPRWASIPCVADTGHSGLSWTWKTAPGKDEASKSIPTIMTQNDRRLLDLAVSNISKCLPGFSI